MTAKKRRRMAIVGAAVATFATLRAFDMAPVTLSHAAEPTTALQALPEFADAGGYRPAWDGIQGLTEQKSDAPRAIPKQQPLAFTAAAVPGRHRFGIRIHGAVPGKVSRTSIWVAAAGPIKFLFNLRDDQSAHTCQVTVALPENTATDRQGDCANPVVSPASNGWTKVSVDMPFANDADFLYILLFGGNDALDYVGDGHTRLDFGGIELSPAS